MAKDQNVKLTFVMSDKTEKEVEFIVPAGEDGMLPAAYQDTIHDNYTAQQFIDRVAEIKNLRGQTNSGTTLYALSFNGVTQYARTTLMYSSGDDYNGSGYYLFVSGPAQLEPPGLVTGLYWLPTNEEKEIVAVYETLSSPPLSFVGSSSVSGQGTTDDPFAVQVSPAEGNALSSTESGLFVAGGSDETLQRGAGGGNFSFGYPDTPSGKNACGKIGNGVYWKITNSLDKAPAGSVIVNPSYWLKSLPCMEDGTLVPYQLIVDYVKAANTNSTPTVAVWLICHGIPTHTINIETKALTKLQRSQGSDTSGLPDYPVAPEGEFAQEVQYSRQYFYEAKS